MAAPASMADFDAVPITDAAAELLPCCASRRWINQLINGRPYRTLEALFAASDAAVARLQWPDVEEALATHPRIGDRVAGGSWSAHEQSGVQRADSATRDALREGNLAYEQRFGHVFLIFATGLSAEQMLAALRVRLANSPDVERGIVREELAKIVRLRLVRAFR
jgi:2-oxo-4-hydroxy-4-carboxy-5-ureidoimidazoline decarboxylase